VDEGESDDDGRKKALSCTDYMACVDGYLDVAGGGRDDSAIDTARWIWVTERLVSRWVARHLRSIKTYPDPEGNAETLEGRLVAMASVSVLVPLRGMPEEGCAVM
jgi:hypothetical protein